MKKHIFLPSISILFIALNSPSWADAPAVPADVSGVVDARKSMPSPRVGGRYNNRDKFKIFDVNADKKLSFEEFYQGKEKMELNRSQKELDEMMQQCDKNNDGVILKSELPDEEALIKAMEGRGYDENPKLKYCMFPKDAHEFMDDNGDGSVTKEEISSTILSGRRPSKKTQKKHVKRRFKAEAKRRTKEFSSCDANGDQLLTLRESFSMKCSLSLFTEQFDAYDINLDSYLTIEEISAEVEPIRYRPEPSDEQIAARAKMPPLVRLETSMFECDTNEDGLLGKNETITKNCEQDLAFFDRVDDNLDGYISHDELERMRMKKDFDRKDKNNNGFLDVKEL